MTDKKQDNRPPAEVEAARRSNAAERDKRIAARARELAEPLCAGMGMELVHVEFRREPGGRILRLYIDKPGGVTLGDCAGISRELGDILDAHLEDSGAYNLEVSSPGLERPVGRLSDFARFAGRGARVRCAEPIEGQKNFTGVLAGVEADEVLLDKGGRIIRIPFDRITRARLTD